MPSITLRNGRWRAEVVRRPRRWSRTFNTKTSARAWALDLEDLLDRGGDPDRPENLTVGEWEKTWWAGRVVEPTTRKSDRSRVEQHILPTWETIPLERVTPMGVQAWIRKLEAKGLAGATIRSCHVLLSGMLSSAVREGLLQLNPCSETKLPPTAVHREVYLTHDEVRHLISVMEEPHQTEVLTLVLTGLRWGEFAGLQVPQVDLLRRRLDVVRVMTAYGPKAYPKGKQRRTVPIPTVLVDALAAHLVGHDGGLVFRSPRNMALHHANWRNNVWVPALGKADLGKSPTIHDLRHTYASHLVQAGVPLEKVRLLLGHTSISTTLRYAHFAPDHAMDAVKALNGIWSGVPEAYATHVEGR